MLGLHPLGGPQPTRLLQCTGDAGSSPEAHMGAQPCSSKTGCRDILPGHHLSPEILPPWPAPRLCRKPGVPSGPLSPGGNPPPPGDGQAAMEATGHQAQNNPRFREAGIHLHSHLIWRWAEPHVLPSYSWGARHPAPEVTLTCGSFWDLRGGLSGRLLAGGSLIH